MILHGYFRSTASWRVRIALELKGLKAEQAFHHLRKGEQRSPAFLDVNPQGLVPALVIEDSTVLTQSLAIIEYLDEVFPNPPLLPTDPVARAKVRAVALAIACDIHPVQNLKVLARVAAVANADAASAWAKDVIEEGLAAVDALLPRAGPFCFGDRPTLADLCLVPQLANARRFNVDLKWPRLVEVESACLSMAAFRDAAPENQVDAE